MSASMRAKMKILSVKMHETSDVLELAAVGPKGPYPADGSDEDNTYAKYSPSATLNICIANPALLGKFRPGETYYVDFTPVLQTVPLQQHTHGYGAVGEEAQQGQAAYDAYAKGRD